MATDPTVSFNDPKMLELLKEINQTKTEIADTADPERVAALRKILSDLTMHYNILSERRNQPGN